MALPPAPLFANHHATVQTLENLSKHWFSGFERLVELHLSDSRAALDEGYSHALATLTTRDPQEWLTLQVDLLQSLTEKYAAYGQHLYTVATDTHAAWLDSLRVAPSLVEPARRPALTRKPRH